MKDIYCNVCGKKLFVEKGILKEDAFEAKKQWGYFSKKDGMLHSFVICEKCYDDMIEKFVIPPEITEVHEPPITQAAITSISPPCCISGIAEA